MRSWSTWSRLGSVVLMLSAVGLSAVEGARAQNSAAASSNDLTPARTSLIEATRKYKTGSENLLRLQEAEIAKATAELEQLRRLVAEGLVAKNELQESEQALVTSQNKIEITAGRSPILTIRLPKAWLLRSWRKLSLIRKPTER